MAKNNPKIGDRIWSHWPGQSELEAFRIADIRSDADGVLCAVFGKNGCVAAEALEDIILVDTEGVIEYEAK